MHNNASYPLMDWVVVTLRWLLLLIATLALALGSGLAQNTLPIFIAYAIFSTLLTALLISRPLSTSIRGLSVGADALFTLAAFYLTGTFLGNLGWLGVVPVLSTSWYFQAPAWVIAALFFPLVQGLIALVDIKFPGMVIPVLGVGALYLLSGGLSALAGQTLIRQKIWSRHLTATGIVHQSLRERRGEIYKLIIELSASLNTQQVFDKAVNLSTEALSQLTLRAEKLVSAVFIFNQETPPRLELVSQRGFAHADLPLTLHGATGLLKALLEDGQPSLSKSFHADTELGQIVSLQKCRSLYAVPLRSGLDSYGLLLFAHPEANFFTPEVCEVLDILGSQALIAMQNARLYQDLEREKERMMEIQEEARKKMARDLHDGPTQSIAAIAMRVNFARRLLDKNPKTAAEELFKIEEMARRTTKEIRHMLFTLRPLVLESQGLVAALHSMADKMLETYGQKVIIEAQPTCVEQLETGKQAVVFYIAEEAVNNARKHAHAEHIWVRLRNLGKDFALLEIEDDGVGFDPQKVKLAYEQRGSLGMVNMREHAELVEGVLRIDAAPQRGTKVQVVIPLTVEAALKLHRGL